MEELEIITLDDGRDYIITDEFLIDGVKYVYLTLEGDIGTFCIRKINIINNEEYLVSLNDKNEFEMALEQFMQKHKN